MAGGNSTKRKEGTIKARDKAAFTRFNSILTLQRQNDIIALLLEGKDTAFITKYVVEKYKLTTGTVINYISSARVAIKERLKYETNTLVSLHINRYEQIYEALYGMGAYAIAMMALRAKEKLMQFHREGFHMRVTSGQINQIATVHVADEYDYMKLPEQKRNRMKELVEKLKEKKVLNG